ncbi:MAG TPA: hypothetical protein VGS27_16980 [Candidatus Sulfotelmatobacter sp.]|nr:hypothetical protein [Candidatus Sulfotelmatobacter sp.]HEV2468557.1 hypothetical protein [Candidatus Sulfotelmatobacter sp.]
MERRIVKRSGWVTGLVVAQFLCGALFVAMCIVLLVLMHQMEVQRGADRASTIEGLKVALCILAPITIVTLAGGWGLARNKLWGWWLAFLTDAGLFGIFVYSTIDDGVNNIDWDMFSFTAIPLALVAWLLVPVVRRFYWASPGDGDSSDAVGVNASAAKS